MFICMYVYKQSTNYKENMGYTQALSKYLFIKNKIKIPENQALYVSKYFFQYSNGSCKISIYQI